MSSRDIQESSKKSSTRIRNDSKSILAALRHGVDNIIRIPGQKMQSGMTERVPPNNDLRRCSNIGIDGQKTQSQVVEICPLEQSSRQCQRESSEPYMYSEEFVPLPKKKGPAIYKTMPTERSLPEQSSHQCPDSNAQFLSQQNQSKLKKRTPPFRNSEEKNLGKNDMGSSHPMMEETHESESSEHYMASEELMPLPKKGGPAIYKTMPTERSPPEQSSRQCPDSNAQLRSQQNQSKLKKRTPPFRNSEEKNLAKKAMGSSHPMMEETHESESSKHYMASEELMPLPKKRGPAICKTMPTESGKRLKVTFNERGQPIWDESKKLVSFLGATVRELIDINIEDWKKVSGNAKDSLWDLTKQKFILPEGAKHRTIRKMGYLWRSSKARYSKIIELCETQEERMSKKPKIIKMEWWKNFVRSRTSRAFQEKSKKFKKLRSKQNLPHTCSRKGYARLEAEMRKESLDPSSITRADVWEKGHTRKNGEPSNREVAEKMRKFHEIKATQPEISSADLKNDAISQVFGDEYRGRVRVYGFGVSPSDVGLISQNQEVIFQLGQQVTELTQKVGDIDALKQEMQQHINEKREMQEQLKNMQNLVSQLLQSQDNASKLPATSTIAPQAPSEGLCCKLFRMDKDDIVAEGRWVTDDPKTKVHGRELGNNASKVWVTKAIEPRSKVWRPTNGIEVMEEAEGSTIAWPTDHVIKDCT